MERAWPCDLDCCKFCEKPTDEVEYKSRGLCVTCFKRVQYKGNLRDYCRYPEDSIRPYESRSTVSGDLAELVYCVRNVGVGEVAKCLCVGDEDVREWLNSCIPIQYKERLIAMKKAIVEEVYEFEYPKCEINPWEHIGDDFYGVSF